MKKLMIAAAVAMAAVAVNAATASWGSTVYFDGEGETLGSGKTKIADGNKGYLFILGVGASYKDAWSQYDTAAKIWDAVKISDDGSSATLAGVDAIVGTAANGNVSFSDPTVYSNRDQIYALAVMTHVDGEGNIDYYSANQVYVKAGTSTVTGPDVVLTSWTYPSAATNPTVQYGADTVWSSVPEPTSGLLLLLGVAGLALRRRRA